MTLRERLHEFMHVGERETWICETNPDLVCPLYKTVVDPLVEEVQEWLRDCIKNEQYSGCFRSAWRTMIERLEKQRA